MSGHTPGPWRVGITTDSDEIEVVSDARPYVCMALPGALDGVTEANARLIAAAPELLEAVERLVCVFGGDEYEHFGSIAYARAIIAKATGEKP